MTYDTYFMFIRELYTVCAFRFMLKTQCSAVISRLNDFDSWVVCTKTYLHARTHTHTRRALQYPPAGAFPSSVIVLAALRCVRPYTLYCRYMRTRLCNINITDIILSLLLSSDTNTAKSRDCGMREAPRFFFGKLGRYMMI